MTAPVLSGTQGVLGLMCCCSCSNLELGCAEINPYLFMAKFSCIPLFKQTLMGHSVASKVLLIARIIEISQLI